MIIELLVRIPFLMLHYMFLRERSISITQRMDGKTSYLLKKELVKEQHRRNARNLLSVIAMENSHLPAIQKGLPANTILKTQTSRREVAMKYN